MAFDADGRIVGLRVKTIANLGSYLSLFAPCVPTYLYGTLLSGQYDIPAIHCEVTGVYTHTTPVDAYRGAGRPEACYLVERMVDIGARALGKEPAELRRQNFIPADKFPFQTQVALAYDSGNYQPALDKALEMLDYKQARATQDSARKEGRYVGIGISSYIEACGLAPSQVAGALGARRPLRKRHRARASTEDHCPTGALARQGHELLSLKSCPRAGLNDTWRSALRHVASVRDGN